MSQNQTGISSKPLFKPKLEPKLFQLNRFPGHMPRLETFTDEGEDDRLFDEFDDGAFKAVGPAQPPPNPVRGYLGR